MATPGITADAFLWEHLSSPVSLSFDAPRLFRGIAGPSEPAAACVIDITPAPMNQNVVPAGMFNQWPLEILLRNNQPFTGLVVLIDAIAHHRRLPPNESALQSITACIAGLLEENDFGCRTTEDEFVMVCHGRQGADAQRHLNYISEQLWQLQQRLHGALSLLFSWGGVGLTERPLAEAIASAVHRMNRMNGKQRRFQRNL
jgi:hypothetical protein